MTRKRPGIFVIEAQAGQGKSSAMGEYLHEKADRTIWYQVGPEDRDAVRFAETLFGLLEECFEGLLMPADRDMSALGDMALPDTVHFADNLRCRFSELPVAGRLGNGTLKMQRTEIAEYASGILHCPIDLERTNLLTA